MVLPNQPDVQMSLAPDGLALLFDQVVTATTSSNSSAQMNALTNEGEAILPVTFGYSSRPPHPLSERLTAIKP